MTDKTKATLKLHHAQWMNDFEKELTNEVKMSRLPEPPPDAEQNILLPSNDDNSLTNSISKNIIVGPYKDELSENHIPIVEDVSLPVSRSIQLKDHTKIVSAVALDPSGARMVTGSYDFTVKFWDFNGMNKECRPFRSIEPWEAYQVSRTQPQHGYDNVLVYLSY
jgi:WD40 repeat protein